MTPLKSAMPIIRRPLSRSPLMTGSSAVAAAEFGAADGDEFRGRSRATLIQSLSQDNVARQSLQPMPTIFRREWDDNDVSSWHVPVVSTVRAMESSGYDLAWTRVGRCHAMKRG
jgi:hypothetical protein